MARTLQVTFDALDPPALAEFWRAALGYVEPPPPDGFESWEHWALDMEIPEESWDDARAIEDPDGDGPRIFIQRVPESKTAKNRVHLDVTVSERSSSNDERRAAIDAEVERLIGLGAAHVADFDQADAQGIWTVMTDPEGNEFCVQ